MLALDWNIIWTIVNIIILYLLLKKFLFGPISEIMEKRTKAIEDSFKTAEHKNKEAEHLKQQYEMALHHAKTEAEDIVKEARERANNVYDQIVKSAEDEAGRVIENANKTIEVERKKTMEGIENEIIGLTLAAASKVLEQNMNEDRNKQLVDDFLAEVGAAK